jgi:hypothetical protein
MIKKAKIIHNFLFIRRHNIERSKIFSSFEKKKYIKKKINLITIYGISTYINCPKNPILQFYLQI